MLIQDGVISHTCKKNNKILCKNNIPVLTQSAKSADLNPIEMIWSILKCEIEQGNPECKQELIECTKSKWEEISQEVIVKSI